ncbi:MAG: hypothetical protein ACI9ZF_003058 [Bradyrhizobium sp.]|jgi:hypothetical protein
MPMLATLEIDGIIRKRELDARSAQCKKIVKRIAYATRELANGLRRRMNQLAEDATEKNAVGNSGKDLPKQVEEEHHPPAKVDLPASE